MFASGYPSKDNALVANFEDFLEPAAVGVVGYEFGGLAGVFGVVVEEEHSLAGV